MRDYPDIYENCIHDWQPTNYVLTTYPPQYTYVCTKCGARKTVKARYTTSSYSTAIDNNEAQTLKLKSAEARIEELEEKIENQKTELNQFKAKADKWKQHALEAENRALDLADESNFWQSKYSAMLVDLNDISREEHKLTIKLEDEAIKYEHLLMKQSALMSEYNKLSSQFISLYDSLCECCKYNTNCCDCGAKDIYGPVAEALKAGLPTKEGSE